MKYVDSSVTWISPSLVTDTSMAPSGDCKPPMCIHWFTSHDNYGSATHSDGCNSAPGLSRNGIPVQDYIDDILYYVP